MLAATLAMVLATVASGRESSEIEARGPDGPLKGTIVLPAKDALVILMIPGSGPTDRDGNSPLGVNAGSYRLMAEGLAEQGIGTVRIDKRGLFGSRSAVRDANAVTVNDYVNDVSTWVDAIRTRTGARCVWLLGHSEGGLVALAASTKVKRLCGVILVATAGQPLGDVLKAQLRGNPANAGLLEEADRVIDTLAAGRRVDASKMQPALLPLFNPAVQDFLISAFALDPAALIGQTKRPILILQGARDLQVSPADADRLKQAAPAASLIILPNANHVLKEVDTDDRSANLATYAAADLPLAPGVVEAIARFVMARGK